MMIMTTRPRPVPLASACLVTLLFCTEASLAAQTASGAEGGQLSPDVRFSMVVNSEGRGAEERRWPALVILWRVPEDRSPRYPRDTAAMQAARRASLAASRAAWDRGRSFLGFGSGTVVGAAEYDRDARQLFVYGRTFPVPARDSALVVMVDRPPGPASEFTVVGSAYVTGTLPAEAWGKHWVSGDTAFSVFPRRRDEHLRNLLEQSAAVRSFLGAGGPRTALGPDRPPTFVGADRAPTVPGAERSRPPDDPVLALRAVQRRRFEAMVVRDLRALDTLLTHDLTYTHTTGAVDSKASLLEDLRAGRLVYDSIVPSDIRVRLYGPTAAVTGLARMQVRAAGGPALRFRIRFTEVYVDNGGRWQLAVWQSTRLPEP